MKADLLPNAVPPLPARPAPPEKVGRRNGNGPTFSSVFEELAAPQNSSVAQSFSATGVFGRDALSTTSASDTNADAQANRSSRDTNGPTESYESRATPELEAQTEGEGRPASLSTERLI